MTFHTSVGVGTRCILTITQTGEYSLQFDDCHGVLQIHWLFFSTISWLYTESVKDHLPYRLRFLNLKTIRVWVWAADSLSDHVVWFVHLVIICLWFALTARSHPYLYIEQKIFFFRCRLGLTGWGPSLFEVGFVSRFYQCTAVMVYGLLTDL